MCRRQRRNRRRAGGGNEGGERGRVREGKGEEGRM